MEPQWGSNFNIDIYRENLTEKKKTFKKSSQKLIKFLKNRFGPHWESNFTNNKNYS